MDQIGSVLATVVGVSKAYISGGTVSQASSAARINISPGLCYAPYSVSVPLSYGAIPPTTYSEDVRQVMIPIPQVVDFPLSSFVGYVADGSTVNYLKVAYIDSDGSTRSRFKSGGSYSYESIPSALITCNPTAATSYEVVIATLVSAVAYATLTVTQQQVTTIFNINAVDTDTALTSNSDTKIASQKATKAYADTKPTATKYVGTDFASVDDASVPSSLAVKTFVEAKMSARKAFALTGAQNWVAPAGVTTVLITACGQGGTGGTAVNATCSGGGGGGGAFCARLPITVTPGASYTWTPSTSGASTLVGTGVNISLGKGGNASGVSAGAGGTGAGGAQSGYNGGAGASSVSNDVSGGGGAGLSENGAPGAPALASSTPGGNGFGFGSILAGNRSTNTLTPFAPNPGAGGNGGYAGLLNGQPGGWGGGGGGGASPANSGSVGGGPYCELEW
jgi:hypothetical protein